MRDRADAVIADRSAADDMRAAADLASRWANFREGWDKPDLSYTAISELDDRLSAGVLSVFGLLGARVRIRTDKL